MDKQKLTETAIEIMRENKFSFKKVFFAEQGKTFVIRTTKPKENIKAKEEVIQGILKSMLDKKEEVTVQIKFEHITV